MITSFKRMSMTVAAAAALCTTTIAPAVSAATPDDVTVVTQLAHECEAGDIIPSTRIDSFTLGSISYNLYCGLTTGIGWMHIVAGHPEANRSVDDTVACISRVLHYNTSTLQGNGNTDFFHAYTSPAKFTGHLITDPTDRYKGGNNREINTVYMTGTSSNYSGCAYGS